MTPHDQDTPNIKAGQTNDPKKIQIIWRQLTASWLAHGAGCNALRGDPVEKPVPPEVQRAAHRLLGIEGQIVVVRFDESLPLCNAIATRGQIIPNNKLKLKRGPDNACHSNSAALWRKHRNKYSLVTGFGLGPHDDLWRAHSWLVAKDGTLVETTTPRRVYVGVILSEEAAEVFPSLTIV